MVLPLWGSEVWALSILYTGYDVYIYIYKLDSYPEQTGGLLFGILEMQSKRSDAHICDTLTPKPQP